MKKVFEFICEICESGKRLDIFLFEKINDNTNEIISKCSSYRLASEVLLPAFEIPEKFKDPLDSKNTTLKIQRL